MVAMQPLSHFQVTAFGGSIHWNRSGYGTQFTMTLDHGQIGLGCGHSDRPFSRDIRELRVKGLDDLQITSLNRCLQATIGPIEEILPQVPSVVVHEPFQYLPSENTVRSVRFVKVVLGMPGIKPLGDHQVPSADRFSKLVLINQRKQSRES